MRIMPASRNWRHVSIFLLAVAVSAALLFTMLTGADGTRVEAQTGDTPTPAPTATAAPGGTEETDANTDGGSESEQGGKADAPKYGNMDSVLNGLVQQVERGIASARSAASTAPLSDDESVAVTLFIEEDYVEAVRQYLDDNGASVRNVGEDYIEAYVPVSLLGSVSQQEGVTSVSAIIPPQPAQETLTSDAVAVHGADIWHAARIKGEGTKIGIIDIGFVGFQDLMDIELPAEEKVHALCFTDLGTLSQDIDDCETESDHGSAVTEAAFDIAPDATYYIANPGSWGDLRTTIIWMAYEGVDVINHSVGWLWTGPGDGSSIIRTSPLNTVHLAVANDITWVNSAGNRATSTWSGAYSDPEGDGVHNFTDTDECNDVLLGADERFIAQLRWDDSWGAPTKDVDLWLFNKDTGERVAASDSFQPEFPIPLEVFAFRAEEKAVYCLSVRLYDGLAPDWIQLQSFTTQDIEHYTLSGSIGTPAESNNPGLLAVGAAPFYNTTEIQDFSSQGPVTPADERIKPDVVGADYAYSVVAGGRVFGTSFGSPHVAGMAALVKQLYPSVSPAGIANYLRGNALERGDEGPDYTWGYGFAVLPAADAPYDPCLEELGSFDDSGEFEIEGTWVSSCSSDRAAEQGTGERYARFYTFEITEDSDISISLTSSEQDTYLYLTEGVGKGGDLLGENDDVDPGSDTNSLIEVEELAAGEYTIEATTFNAGETGDFTLTLSIEITSRQPDPRIGGFIEVRYGSDHACALNADGSIACWGSNEHGKATPPEGEFKTVSSGEHGSCGILREDSAVVCWGIFKVGP